MKDNEKQNFRNIIMLNKENFVILENSSKMYKIIMDNIRKVEQFEAPDLYIKNDDRVIGIECFKFSAYKTTKAKGDCSKKLQEEIFNKNQETFENSSDHNLYIEEDFKEKKSRQDYEDNFINIFNKHYQKINNYIKNLEQISKNVEIIFYIEDETLEKNEINYNGKNILYNFTMNKNILNFLVNKTKITGIIFKCNMIEKDKIYFFEITPNNIKELQEKNKKYFNSNIEEREIKIVNFFSEWNG